MSENPGPKVPFTVGNITRCMCPRCPVQTGSQCINEKLGKLDEVMESADKAPIPQEVPGVYCSTGAATCKDLDPSQMCICGSCAVWHEYKLVSRKPIYYFCTNGRAQ
jgi:hypothetical protein